MRGHIVKRSKNSWSIVLSLGRDDKTGKRVRKWMTVKGPKRDAEKRLTELIRQADTGVPMDTSKETVRQFLAGWLTDDVARTTRPRTLDFYSQMVRLYINPEIGDIRLQKLTPRDVKRMIKSVLDKGLSPTTARRVYATLHRALVCAVKSEAVHRNVCDAVDAPREADHEISPPDQATVKTLLEKAMQTPYGAAFSVLAHTGMRRGEVCALRWEHLDMDRGTLSIAGAVGREDSKLTVTPPKSSASRRMIHLGESTLSVLRAHRVQQAEHRLKLGEVYQDRGYVFASPTGGLLDPNLLTKTWQATCREVGVKYRLHDLRHHHATALIENGVHIKTVQNRLGHSSPSLTMSVYAHISPGMDRQAAEAYDRAMSG